MLKPQRPRSEPPAHSLVNRSNQKVGIPKVSCIHWGLPRCNSSSFCERMQNPVHEVGIVADVLDFVTFGRRFEEFKNDSSSAATAFGKCLVLLQNCIVWWPVPEMEHAINSRTFDPRSCPTPHRCLRDC